MNGAFRQKLLLSIKRNKFRGENHLESRMEVKCIQGITLQKMFVSCFDGIKAHIRETN